MPKTIREQIDETLTALVKAGIPNALNTQVAFAMNYTYMTATINSAEAGDISPADAADHLIWLTTTQIQQSGGAIPDAAVSPIHQAMQWRPGMQAPDSLPWELGYYNGNINGAVHEALAIWKAGTLETVPSSPQALISPWMQLTKEDITRAAYMVMTANMYPVLVAHLKKAIELIEDEWGPDSRHAAPMIKTLKDLGAL